MKQTFNIGDIFLTSWKFTKSQLAILCGLLIGYTIIAFTLSILTSTQTSIVATIVLNIIGGVIGCLFAMGYIKNLFQTIDDIEPQFSAYGQQASKILKYIAVNLVVGLACTIGFCLFILPGIYLMCRMQYALAFIIEEDEEIIESIKRSWAMTQVYAWKLVGLFFVQFLICLIGVLLFGVGLFIAYPLIAMMYCYSFRVLNSPLQLIEEA